MNRNANAWRWIPGEGLAAYYDTRSVSLERILPGRPETRGPWRRPTPAIASAWRLVEDYRYRRHLTFAAMRAWVPAAPGTFKEGT